MDLSRSIFSQNMALHVFINLTSLIDSNKIYRTFKLFYLSYIHALHVFFSFKIFLILFIFLIIDFFTFVNCLYIWMISCFYNISWTEFLVIEVEVLISTCVLTVTYTVHVLINKKCTITSVKKHINICH